MNAPPSGRGRNQASHWEGPVLCATIAAPDSSTAEGRSGRRGFPPAPAPPRTGPTQETQEPRASPQRPGAAPSSLECPSLGAQPSTRSRIPACPANPPSLIHSTAVITKLRHTASQSSRRAPTTTTTTFGSRHLVFTTKSALVVGTTRTRNRHANKPTYHLAHDDSNPTDNIRLTRDTRSVTK